MTRGVSTHKKCNADIYIFSQVRDILMTAVINLRALPPLLNLRIQSPASAKASVKRPRRPNSGLPLRMAAGLDFGDWGIVVRRGLISILFSYSLHAEKGRAAPAASAALGFGGWQQPGLERGKGKSGERVLIICSSLS